LEGLASGPAILAPTGSSLQQLDGAHPQWDIEADYLGQLCAQVVLTLSPQRIVMGGGVMTQLRGRCVFVLDRYHLASSCDLFDGRISATQFARDLLRREHH